MQTPKLIAITPGEPAGIGPDIVLRASQDLLAKQIQPLVIADINLLRERAKQLKIDINITPFEKQTLPTSGLACLHVPLDTPAKAGQANPTNASYVLNCLRQAAEGCKNQTFAGMVTGPVNKAIINDSGIPFSGHTEFLAELDQNEPVMMLASQKMRVALVTTHLPLHQVSTAITKNKLQHVIDILHHDLKTKFHIESPNILVLGLNPHAGENGHLGDEEIETIGPVLTQLRKQGISLTGPLPADTAFNPNILDKHDAVLAMYHDQGLPVLKYSGFGEAVNITLGLSFIRTSVDHGTAFELAGTGKASHSSLLAAYHAAEEMIHA